MAMDFYLTPDGELALDTATYGLKTNQDTPLKIQLAYARIKSIKSNWYMDNIGANLEELIGKPCTESYIEAGKSKILQALTEDGLWSQNDIAIKAKISDNTSVTYTIYLKVYTSNIASSYEIQATLDMVKGVYVKYGW